MRQTLSILLIAAAKTLAQTPAAQRLQFEEIPLQLRNSLPPKSEFPDLLARIEQDTARREEEGENDHLIFYMLQSRKFTALPPIEPALSARDFHAAGRVPPNTSARIAAFLKAVKAPADDPRLRYFARFLKNREPLDKYVAAQYGRAMRFLYEKEFAHPESDPAQFYPQRGHSTDTSLAASFTVWNALSVLKQIKPEASLRRVLIVGPGLDFAPRTAYSDELPPQSYQPYAVVQALLDLKLSTSAELQIHCVDINARVIDFLNHFPGRLDIPRAATGDPDFDSYVQHLRTAKFQSANVSASRLNIITGHLDSSFDLILVTNVLLYFNSTELALALTNIAAMLQPGAILIHNDRRPEIDGFTQALRLDPLHARILKIADGPKAPLFDSFAIYTKK